MAPHSQRGLSVIFLRKDVLMNNNLVICEYGVFCLVSYRNSSIEVAF